MERFQRIIQNKYFREEYDRLKELEKDRRFCCHDMEHILAVARICYIIVLERQAEVSKDVVYGTAFLRDLGRRAQYEEGKSHEEEGARLAGKILPACGYEPWEVEMIVETIRGHRKESFGDPDHFANIFYKADKLSRDCLHCEAKEECYWPEEKKNNKYQY